MFIFFLKYQPNALKNILLNDYKILLNKGSNISHKCIEISLS